MSFHFRPATRERTPIIAGISGPTKSGKTYSSHRVAAGIAQGGTVVMINAEGARGHQYADKFSYLTADIRPPYAPKRYTEALKAAIELKPAVVIIDSMSHMHDGPGGMLEYHESELDRLAGPDADYKRRKQFNWTAWIKPKAEENEFIYTMLDSDCHFVLCFRAKEKLRIVSGKEPENLGWQPIASDRVAFETLFTLVLPPHSKGVPDMTLSEMREPFDSLIKPDVQLSEATGVALAEWSAGAPANTGTDEVRAQILAIAGERGNADDVAAAIEKHAAESTPTVHSRWLTRQLARLTEQVPA